MKDQSGVLHVPLALLTALMVLTGLSILGLLHHWKSLTETQLRLDRCTGEAALELKSKLRTIAGANRHMKELRIAEAAAEVLNPEAAQVLRALVVAESIHQESIRAEWMMKQAKWLVQSGTCGSRGDFRFPLPSLGWDRAPPDALGPQPIALEELPDSFHFEVRHPPRASAAEVITEGEGNGPLSTPRWRARWVAPHGALGASLH